MKFNCQATDPFNGNDMVYKSLGPNATRRHRHFKCFFAIQDPRLQVPTRKTHPNWKVGPLLKHALSVCKEAMVPGRHVAIDEQTIGFQGNHEDKKRHDEKNEGDGFQADSLNIDGGYTWAFYFRNQPAPPTYIQMGMSPLHARTLALIQQLNYKHHCIFMDNLYLSAKLCLYVWKLFKCFIHGVVRQGGRGVPNEIKQEQKTKHQEEYQARGTLMSAVCTGDPNMTEIICTSLYDVKPFYMMTTVSDQIVWTKKYTEIFCTTKKKKVNVPFYRLNIADLYNQKMGQVDVGDQLRNYYRFDHWMRKRKWWWSIWMWCFGMLLTNAYILYSKYCKIHKVKQKYNHYGFICKVAEAWLHPDPFFTKDVNSYSVGGSDTTSMFPSDFTLESNQSEHRRKRRRCTIIEDTTDLKRNRNTSLTDKTIDTSFPHRLDLWRGHWPVMAETKNPARCQMHSWATESRIRKKAKVMMCEVCKVNLCSECFKEFHMARDLLAKKDELRRFMLADK